MGIVPPDDRFERKIVKLTLASAPELSVLRNRTLTVEVVAGQNEFAPSTAVMLYRTRTEPIAPDCKVTVKFFTWAIATLSSSMVPVDPVEVQARFWMALTIRGAFGEARSARN